MLHTDQSDQLLTDFSAVRLKPALGSSCVRSSLCWALLGAMHEADRCPQGWRQVSEVQTVLVGSAVPE